MRAYSVAPPSGGGAGSFVSLGTGDGSTRTFNFPSPVTGCTFVIVGGVIQSPTSFTNTATVLTFASGNAPDNGASVEALVSA